MVELSLPRFTILASLCVPLCSTTAWAQCADWSAGFAPPGLNGSIAASVVYDDGSGPALYVVGDFTRAPGMNARSIARWNGTAWSPFGTGLDGRINAITTYVDGGIEKLVIGGEFKLAGETVASDRVAIWNGSAWNALGAALPPEPQFGDSEVMALTVFDDGLGAKLYVGGALNGGVRRWSGSAWTLVGSGLFSGPFDDAARVLTLCVHDDGLGGGAALYAGGSFDRTGTGPGVGPNIARLSGGVWTGVGSGLGTTYENFVSDLSSFDDGVTRTLVAAGSVRIGGVVHPIASWNGSAWSAFPVDPDGTVGALLSIAPGAGVTSGLWIAGDCAQIGGVAAQHAARWDGANWNAVGGESRIGLGTSLCVYDSGAGPRMHACGAQGVVERLEGSTWTATTQGGGASDVVSRLVTRHEAPGRTSLLASGTFTSIGGVAAPGFAKWDGASWSAGDLLGYVKRWPLEEIDLGNGPEFYSIAQSASAPIWHVVRETNSGWSELPPLPTYSGYPPYDLAVFDDGHGKALYASGQYGLWRLDGASWTSVIPQPNQPIRALAVFDDGSGPALYLSGQFNSIGGQPFGGIARWNGTSLDTLGGGVASNRIVQALRVWDDGSGPALYAAGNFTSIGGVPIRGLARWDGQTWSEVGGGLVGGLFLAQGLDIHDDGSGAGSELVVFGYLSSVGGQAASGVARWNGTTWRTMNGGVSDALAQPTTTVVSATASFDDGSGRGPELFVAGNFMRAGNFDSAHIARWTSCGGDVTSFCHGDGSATACPCGNASAVGANAGCLNSLGVGATLRVHGRASLTSDSLVLEGAAMPNSTALYFQAANLAFGGQGFVFGDGVKCVAGPFVRLLSKINVQGISSYPQSGDLPVSVRGHVASSGTRHYAIHYRNAANFCTPSTFNNSNAVSVFWAP